MQKYLLDKVENGPNIGNGVPLYNFVGKQILQASVAALFNDQVADTDGIFEAFLEFDKVMPMCLGGAHISYFSKGYNALKFLDESVAKTFMNNWCDLLNTIANRWIQIRSEGRSDPKDKIRVLLPYFWASVSNSMPATFWMLYYLLKDPDLLEKVIAEVDRVVADGGEGQNLTTEHMASMHLVDACITEALRLHSGSLIMRDVLSPCSLVLASGRSYNFRKGDRVCIFPTMTNLDPEIFPEPNRYNPLRWLEGVTTEEEKAAKSMGKITLVKDNKELARYGLYCICFCFCCSKNITILVGQDLFHSVQVQLFVLAEDSSETKSRRSSSFS